MPTRQRQHGFTIIELMVTMSILGLMLFLVNQLFNDTSQAVQTSVQTSKTISTSRSINEQLTADADAMVGPGDLSQDPGYIVIIQQRIPNATLLDPQNLTEVTVTELRTDQLLFIRDGEGLKSMTPASTNGYGTNFVGQPGDRAKVWYGHALRTLPNGQLTGTTAAFQLGGASARLDKVGNNFILGRQAMLFNPTNAATGNKLDFAPGTFIHAVNGYYGSAVNNSGYTGGAQTFKGLSDITIQNYGPRTGAIPPLTLLDQLTDGSGDNNDYINTAYPNAANRLRVNTAPNPAPAPAGTNYAAWSIAQGHPILAQGCSEIIVDFAADLNGDGKIDTQFGGQGATGAPIYWYDALKQAGNFAWAPELNTDPLQPFFNTNSNTKSFIFRVNDKDAYDTSTGSPAIQDHSNWPYLIRIRYRLHDTRGRLNGNYAAALNDGLDNDGDGTADESGEDRIAGRWFERIISVPRP